ELREPITVQALLDHLKVLYPALSGPLSSVLVAINHEYANGEQIVQDGDEIGLFPPVSGG
nr:MoaD/ThiS family protein [Anaerolineae bacterium]